MNAERPEGLVTLQNLFWTQINADFADSKEKICVISVNQRPNFESARQSIIGIVSSATKQPRKLSEAGMDTRTY